MCVTNTTSRRPVTLTPAQLASSPSMLSQRICSSLFLPTAASTISSTTVYPEVEKPRPKRRRKPQKPGKTAKMNDRHFVIHNYHDHSQDPMEPEEPVVQKNGKRRRGGVAIAFPIKLHALLDQIEADGLAHVISWQPHGRAFVVHKPKEFVAHVMPKYFKQTKLTSFQRQLNLYGFQRLTRGPDAGGYYHELFLRGKTFLCKKMTRTKVKGTGFKAASSPDQEPDLYKMRPIIVTPNHSSDDDSSAHSSDDSVPAQMPIVYTEAQLAPIPVVTASSQPPPASYSPLPFAMPDVQPSSVDVVQPNILDNVVDELFLSENSSQDQDDDILDFVNTWNPMSEEDDMDDEQLGAILERILED